MTHHLSRTFQTIVISGVLLVCCAVASLSAQERGGALTGQLVDQSGGSLPKGLVVIRNTGTGRVTTVVTDEAGTYRAAVEPGVYRVEFQLSGFARQVAPDVEVQLGRTFILNATMRLGSLTEAVQVTVDSGPLVDTRSAIIAHNVTAEEIDRMPKGRTFQSIALTAPSVNAGEIEGGFQVNGASGAENGFTIDGVNTTSLINGASRQNTVFEYIQEVQVKTTGITAEYGGALGGVISAVTKSGGNTFAGEVHYYFDGSALSASPVKRLVLSPLDEATVIYVQDRKQPDIRHELGASVGGPIVRDRLFFFGALSPRMNTRTNTYKFAHGTDQGSIKRTTKLVQAFGKVSYGSRRVNAYGAILATPTYVSGTLPSYNGTGPEFLASTKASNAPNSELGWEQMQVNTTANMDIVLSNAAYATIRGGYFHDRYSDRGFSETTNYIYQTAAATASLGLPASLLGPQFTQNTPRARVTNFDTTRRRFINAGYNQTFQGGGWHILTGGAGYQRAVNEVNSSYPGGYVDIFWGIPAVLPGQTSDTGPYGYYAVTNRGTIGTAGADIISLYLQDQWQVADRVTLSLGLRSENEKVPSFRTELRKYALDFGFMDKIAPRLGFTYDVMGNHRSKLYASWGRYFDWTKYELPRNLFGGDVWCIHYRAIDDPSAPVTASLSNMPGRDLWKGSGTCRDRRVPNFETVDPAIKPMSQDSYSAGFEVEIGPRTSAAVRYVRNRLIRTIEDLGALVEGNEVYYIANPGEGGATLTPTSTAPLTPTFETPRPVRQYDAVEFALSRRFAKNWFGSGNITISRLFGNYAGLANSDEIHTPTTGVGSVTAQQQGISAFRQGGNMNRAWDTDEQMFDSHGNLDPLGRLATDRPVVVKAYGAYAFAENTQVGLFFYGGTGTPITTYVATEHQTDLFVEGRGDMGRTPFFTRTDFLLSHEHPLAGNKRIRFELNVLNVFNQKTARHIFNYLNRGAGAPRVSSAISLADTNLYNGYDYRAKIASTPDGNHAYDPRYGMADLFEPGAQGQFTVKFVF